MTTPQPTTVPSLTPEQAKRQADILSSGEGWQAFAFAVNTPGADIPALQKRVMAAGDGRDWTLFAMCVPGADVEALYAAAQEQGFDGLSEQQRSSFDDLLAGYRAQRQLAAG